MKPGVSAQGKPTIASAASWGHSFDEAVGNVARGAARTSGAR
jgi:hypothetical protein